MEAVAPWLRQLRVNEGITQAEAAARIGVNPKTIERWEAGKHEPPASELAVYVRALGGEVRDLLSRLVKLDNVPDLTADDQDLIARITRLSPEQRRVFRQLVDLLPDQ